MFGSFSENKRRVFFLMYDNSNKPNNFQIWWPILFQLSRNCVRYTLVFLHELVNNGNNCTTASLWEVYCCYWLVCHLPPLFMHKMCEYFKICNWLSVRFMKCVERTPLSFSHILSPKLLKEFRLFNVWVSVHLKSILYKEPTRCNFGSIVS